MKKIWITLGIIAYLILLIVIYKTSFFKTLMPPKRVLESSLTNFQSKLDLNSPEGLAQVSGLIYKDMALGNISAEEAVAKLEQLATKNSEIALEQKRQDFVIEIKDYINYSKRNNIRIRGFEFAKTVYPDPGKAYIERIQRNNKGRDYYYRQDFILEDGKWKIIGDNAQDPFRIKRSWMFLFMKRDERGIMYELKR